MRRRGFLALAGALAIGGEAPAFAQARAKPYRIGGLRGGSAPNQIERFKARLAELGYSEPRDFVMEFALHKGQIEQIPELARELVQKKPDVIVASGAEAVLKALLATTSSIPIVFLAVDFDPIAQGYVSGLPRPGGNITGVFLRQVELTAKRVELLKEALPALNHFAVFADAFTPDTSGQMRAAEAAATRLGLRLVPGVLPNAPNYDFTAALEAASANGAEALLALMSPGFFGERARFVRSVSAQRMPASFGLREFAELGGLMSYGANIVEMYGRAADYVAKILAGAKAGDLPVEQPTKFELVVNLKTAKELGLAMPQALLARADEVIE